MAAQQKKPSKNASLALEHGLRTGLLSHENLKRLSIAFKTEGVTGGGVLVPALRTTDDFEPGESAVLFDPAQHKAFTPIQITERLDEQYLRTSSGSPHINYICDARYFGLWSLADVAHIHKTNRENPQVFPNPFHSIIALQIALQPETDHRLVKAIGRRFGAFILKSRSWEVANNLPNHEAD